MTDLAVRFTKFGELLRHLRLQARLTQREFAHAVGYSAAQVNRLEQGVRRPEPAVVAARFLEALDLDTDSPLAQRLLELSKFHLNEKALQRYPLIPVKPNELIGQSSALTDAIELLQRKDVRLVTFLGLPGIGKTRLAIEVTHEIGHAFADGICFVNLAPITEVSLVTSTILAALGVTDTDSEPLQRLYHFLHKRQMLLVLDNFEQLLPASSIVSELLAAAPLTKVIVTSRSILQISAEHVFDVPVLSHESAYTLFLTRAQALISNRTFSERDKESVRLICHRLGYLPLSIELAASHVRVLSPSEIATRLSSQLSILTNNNNDLPERQRSLRGAIEWSYNLLEAHEQRVFSSLGIFHGSFDLAAVGFVANIDQNIETLHLIQSLAHKSLIVIEQHHESTRIHLPEIIHEFALETLIKQNLVQVHAARHARYYVDYICDDLIHMRKGELRIWGEAMDIDSPNIYAALSYFLGNADIPTGVRLLHVTDHYWRLRNQPIEAAMWIGRYLDHSETQRIPSIRAGLLVALYNHQRVLGTDSLEALAEEALTILYELKDKATIAHFQKVRGLTARRSAKFALSRSYLQQSARYFSQHEDAYSLAEVTLFLAATERDAGNFDQSIELLQQVQILISKAHAKPLLWWYHVECAILAYMKNDVRLATDHLNTATQLGQKVNMASREPTIAWLVGRVALSQNKVAQALPDFELAVSDLRRQGNIEGLGRILAWLAFAQHLSNYEKDQVDETIAESLNINFAMKRWLVWADCVRVTAWIAIDRGYAEKAATLLGVVSHLCAEISAVLPLGDLPLHEPRLQAIHRVLNSTALANLYAKGAAMSQEQANAYAKVDVMAQLGNGTQRVIRLDLPNIGTSGSKTSA